MNKLGLCKAQFITTRIVACLDADVNARIRGKKREDFGGRYIAYKFPGADWPREEFATTTVRLASGQTFQMELAEREVFLAGKLQVRELRKLRTGGHQTSILATDYITESSVLAGAMFSRWSQENFFRYMREHYALDRLVDRGLEDLDETTRLVNPAYRRLDGAVRKQVAVLSRQQAKFGALTLEGELEENKLSEYERRKATLLEEVQRLEADVEALKAQRKQVPRHIQVSELPKEDRFQCLRVAGKHLVDTIKMIAYRAETMLVQIAREQMSRTDDGRQLIASLFQTTADLHPAESEGTLTVCTIRPITPMTKSFAICAPNSTPPPPTSQAPISG